MAHEKVESFSEPQEIPMDQMADFRPAMSSEQGHKRCQSILY
jgi:hypothetical protein